MTEFEHRVVDTVSSCWEQISSEVEGRALQEWLWIIHNHVERKIMGYNIPYAPVSRLIQALLSPHCPPTVILWLRMGGYGEMSLREFVEASHGT